MSLSVEVWGDFAAFVRPELKVERVTYQMMTPSAARGVLEAIFWRPEFYWRIREIWVMHPIKYVSLLRNELQTKQSERSAKSWGNNGGGYFAEDDRSQRHTLALRDVRYIIKADIRLQPHATDPLPKYTEQFKRRVTKGRCFQQPYMGSREFVASFGQPDPKEKPIDLSMDLGRMLLDQQFRKDDKGPLRYWRHDTQGRTLVRGTSEPRFFVARLERGVLRIPSHDFEGREGNAP